MVPGINGGELIVIAVVALVVVGPQDLPKLLRQVGRVVGKARRMVDDFREALDDMARQSEVEELRKQVDALRENADSELRRLQTEAGAAVTPAIGHAPAVVRDNRRTGDDQAADPDDSSGAHDTSR